MVASWVLMPFWTRQCWWCENAENLYIETVIFVENAVTISFKSGESPFFPSIFRDVHRKKTTTEGNAGEASYLSVSHRCCDQRMLTAPIVTSGRFSVKQLCNTARQRLSGINQETPETQKDVREFCMTKHAMYALHTTTFSSETVHRDKRRQVTMILHLFGSWICIQKIFVRTIDHYGGFDAGSFMTCSRFDLSFLDLWIFMA